MEKEIDKFSEKVEGVSGDQIPEWDWPKGGIDNFLDSLYKVPTLVELKSKKEDKSEDKIEKAEEWRKYL